MDQKVIFGLSLETEQRFRENVEAALGKKIPGIQCVCRYRKDGIIQYLAQQEEAIVIIEEKMQGGSPYTTAELQQLTDLGRHHIIYLMDQKHQGDDYIKELYCCGIYDALYLEQTNPKEVQQLVFRGRTCTQARKYYKIENQRDAEKNNNIVNEYVLGTYLEFVEDGSSPEEIDKRYRFAATRLGVDENRVLAASLTRPVAEELIGNEIYQYYRSPKEKRRIFPRIIGKKKPEDANGMMSGTEEAVTAPLSEKLLEQTQPLEMTEPETAKEDELKVTIPFAGDDKEDMLAVLDKFRSAADEGQIGMFYEPAEDLREILGGFLKTVDV